MPNNFIPIATITVSSEINTIEFASIANTYQHLHLRGKVRDTGGGGKDLCRVRFNNDGAGNYRNQIGYIRGTADNIVNNTSGQTGGTFDCTSGGANGVPNVWTNVEVYIPNYKSTSTRKTGIIKANTTQTSSATQGNSITGFASTALDSTAINSVSFFAPSNWAVGSKITLYGYTIS